MRTIAPSQFSYLQFIRLIVIRGEPNYKNVNFISKIRQGMSTSGISKRNKTRDKRERGTPREKRTANDTKKAIDTEWSERIIKQVDVDPEKIMIASRSFPNRLFWQCDTHPGFGVLETSWIDLVTGQLFCPFDKTRTRASAKTLRILRHEVAIALCSRTPNKKIRFSFRYCLNGVNIPLSPAIENYLIMPQGPFAFPARTVTDQVVELPAGNSITVVLPRVHERRKNFSWRFHAGDLQECVASPSEGLPDEKMVFTIQDIPEEKAVISLVVVYEDSSVWAVDRHRSHVYRVLVTSPDVPIAMWEH